MELKSIRSLEFLIPVEEALEKNGELLFFHRYSNAVGYCEWFMIHDFLELDQVLNGAKKRSLFIAYLEPLLPLRGFANQAIQNQCAQLFPGYAELLLTQFVPGQILLKSYEIENIEELDEWFSERWGAKVACGPHPYTLAKEGVDMLTAYLPDADGVVRHGIY